MESWADLDARLVSGEAWADFCDSLKTVGLEIVGDGYPANGLDRADGFRHLALLLETALRWYIGNSDPDFPRFSHMNDTPEIADNWFAPIRGDATYRVTGNIATVFDVNISVHDGFSFLGKRNVWGDLGRSDLEVHEDGDFELILSAEPHSGNWLAIPAEAAFVHIREYFNDWSTETSGWFEIVRVGSEGDAPPRLQPARVAAQLDDVVSYVSGYLASHKQMLERSYPSARNEVSVPHRHLGRGGNKNISYGMGTFALEPGEALVLEFDEPDARAWTVQWLTTPWYENPDMANRVTSINGHDAHVGADGKVRVVLSDSDPGVPNWLDTSGYRTGPIVTRWIWCKDDGPVVATEIVRVEQLRTRLPEGTPEVSAAARAGEIARRRSHLARRGR